jgi:DNA-binding MarR family transcriptional regulator
MPSTTTSRSLVDSLFQTSFLLHARLARVAAAHDLTIIQVRLLAILRDRTPGMLELADHLAIRKSSLSGLVDRAEARGLVERMPSPEDGRAAHIRSTPRGRTLSRLIEQEVTADVSELVAVLPKADRNRLSTLLNQLLAATTATSGPRSGT